MVVKPVAHEQSRARAPIAGEAFLSSLADHGVDFFFANPGTDFPPIVEAFSRGRQANIKLPRPLVIPHENVAMASPRGPVYLVLPREPLSAAMPELSAAAGPRPIPAAPYPDPTSIETLASWIAAAERPLIITASLGADAVPGLSRVAERWALPVVSYNPRTMCVPSSHPMHFGFEPGALLTEADLVIVIESDVPW